MHNMSASQSTSPVIGAESAAGGSPRKIRVAHLVSHPVQYLVPIYRQISQHPAIDFTVYFYSDASIGKHFDHEFGREFEWSTPLLGGYQHRFLRSSQGRVAGGPFTRPNWDLFAEVLRQKYDVIWVNSYVGSNAWLARLAALVTGTPIFFRDDTNLLTPRPLWKRAVKQVVLRSFLRGAWALYVGEQSRRYWEYYGVARQHAFFSPHCVDNEFWSSKARELAPQRSRLRQSFGFDDSTPVILFCGKFIPKKQPMMLLAAYSMVRKTAPCTLLMVGDGYLRAEVEAQIRAAGIEGVVLAGFLNQDELPAAYAAADIFVLPSAFHETWGLVVNEAMNFGLPIVVSDRVGCGRDLVREGWNGFSFAHDDVAQLAACLTRLVQDADLRGEFGRNSAQLVAEYSVEKCANGIVQAVRAADGAAA